MRPIILISPDREAQKTRRGEVPIHVLDQHYAQAVQNAGGLPFVMPYTNDSELINESLALCHGLLLTGGAFDIDPRLFNETPHPSLGPIKDDRTAFEIALLDGAQQKKLPIFGICGGMQLMNVCAKGGSLWQDLPSQNPSLIQHEQVAAKKNAGHDVKITINSRLAQICGTQNLGVNSTHHQAIRHVGEGFAACAMAPDQIVEAIEAKGEPFVLGVQWHPEAMPEKPRQQALYRAFIDAAREFSASTASV